MKKFLIVLASIVTVICLGIDIWYLYVTFYGKERVPSHTYEVGVQKLKDGTYKYFIEVNAYKNLFEVKFNYMLDENQTSFYSQGIQIYSGNSPINFDATYSDIIRVSGDGEYKKEYGWPYYTTYNRYVMGNPNYRNVSYHNYMSGDDYKTTTYSTNPIGNDTMFKIQLGKKLYGLKFKGVNHSNKFDSKYYIDYNLSVNSKFFVSEVRYEYYYRQCDIYYFIELLYNSIFNSNSSTTLEYGTSQPIVFEFGNLFNYYECIDESKGLYEKDAVKDTTKVVNDFKSYYAIKVTIHDGEVKSSKDSLFGVVNGSVYFQTSDNIEFEDYFIGRVVKKLTINDFVPVEYENNVRKLKLRQDFIDCHIDYASDMLLDIVIDLDSFDDMNLEFAGFEAGALDDFNLRNGKYRTTKTIDGVIVESEVSYA